MEEFERRLPGKKCDYMVAFFQHPTSEAAVCLTGKPYGVRGSVERMARQSIQLLMLSAFITLTRRGVQGLLSTYFCLEKIWTHLINVFLLLGWFSVHRSVVDYFIAVG